MKKLIDMNNPDEVVSCLLEFYDKHDITSEKQLIKELQNKDPLAYPINTCIDLSKYQKVKENNLHIVYIEKNPIYPSLRQIFVYYKKYNRSMLGILTEELYNTFLRSKSLLTQKQR